MKILFIGGTGIISTAVSKLVLKRNDELFVLNILKNVINRHFSVINRV